MASTPKSRPLPTSGGGGKEHDYAKMTAQELEQRREEEMNRQDEELEVIHHGVNGLKQHAIAINEAVVEDIEIINDLDNRMDRAQVDVKGGTDKAIEVNKKKAKVCKLYCVIAVLVVAEVVLSAAGISLI